jgi:hypothetical protein
MAARRVRKMTAARFLRLKSTSFSNMDVSSRT